MSQSLPQSLVNITFAKIIKQKKELVEVVYQALLLVYQLRLYSFNY